MRPQNIYVKNNAGGDREENDFPSVVVDPGSVRRSAESPSRRRMPPKHFPMPILSFRSGRTYHRTNLIPHRTYQQGRFDRCWNSGSASETESVPTARCGYFPPTVFACRYSSESAQVPPIAANLRFGICAGAYRCRSVTGCPRTRADRVRILATTGATTARSQQRSANAS